ncbi:MAG: peptidyl-prolyl cis-trans isomerase [Acidobacteria bacterium]|nr:peptidyl-prolyl cis-trans isomerase [Acidobacteriota bacterium]
MIRFLQTPGPIKKIVLGGLLTIICVFMVITLIPGFGNSNFLGMGAPNPGVLATVSGEEIATTSVQRQARQMVEQQYPRGGAQARMLMPFFAERAAQNLINEKILLLEAGRLGLRATDEDLREYMRQGQLGEMVFPGGTFIGQQEYEDFVSRIGYTVPQFEQLVKDEILVKKISSLVTAGASVTDAEVKQQFEKQNTKVKFDYAVFKKDDILKAIHPADAELKAYYDRNKKTYVNSIPEKRQLKYVVIDNARLAAQTQVSEAELENYYDQHRDEYRVPEQVNVRQIVIKKPLPGPDGKADQKQLDVARTKAEDVLKQLKAGGNFAELAKKYSEDPDTAKKGGSVGLVRPDVFPDAGVKKAVTTTPKGSTSELIDASYAFVIIHVEDKQAAYVKNLNDVKAQIEPIIKQEKAAQAAQHEADQLLSEARSTSLEKAAAGKGLQVITTDFVTSKDQLPGIGSDQQFMTAAFGQTANAPPDEVALHQGYTIYQVTAVKPSATPTFEEARSRVEQEFKNERAAQLLTQKTQELADRAKAGHDVKKAAKELGAEYKTSDFVLPDGQVPDIGSMSGPAAVAFTLKRGEVSGPIDTGASGAVLTVVDRQAPSDQDFAAKRDQVRETLLEQKRSELFNLFLANLRETMEKSGKVKINQKELQSLTKVRTEESE